VNRSSRESLKFWGSLQKAQAGPNLLIVSRFHWAWSSVFPPMFSQRLNRSIALVPKSSQGPFWFHKAARLRLDFCFLCGNRPCC